MIYRALILFAMLAPGHAELGFNDDIRPILSDRCFACHGPDAANQKSDLRLDTFAEATADLGGYAAIVPGKPEESELIHRIHTHDTDEMMPPPKSKLSITDTEKELLARWIREGATYQDHWAFVPPTRPEPPEISEASTTWAQNPIDVFIAARLEAENLTPAPAATPEQLRRRTALALTGLLPNTPAKLTGAEQIEHLLDGMDYAERQALFWLDASRFADTDGYQTDRERSNWPWRDWVIQAFHSNQPFDQFTIEQIAGDMIPEASVSQRLASAFNRNHRQNAEGGALAEEFFVENVIDRVETTSTIWLGLTLGCARCHDHKYDPLSQKEFFQMYAFFNNIGENGTGAGINANPIMNTVSPLVPPSPELEARKAAAQEAVKQAEAGLTKHLASWEAELQATKETPDGDWATLEVLDATSSTGELKRQKDDSWFYTGPGGNGISYTVRVQVPDTVVTALKLEALSDKRLSAPRQLAPSVNGNFVVTDIALTKGKENIAISDVQASFAQDGYPASHLNDDKKASGWAVFDKQAGNVSAMLKLANPLAATEGTELTITIRHDSNFAAHNVGRFRLLYTSVKNPSLGQPSSLPDPILQALAVAPEKRNAKQKKALRDHVRTFDQPSKKAAANLKKVDAALRAAGLHEVPVMVMQEAKTVRPTYLLERGLYTEPDKSEVLARQVPAALYPLDAAPLTNRLDLANWLVSPQNPLTARVTVNRIWQQHFGMGLVKTAEDFGSQGERPSHPALLDWLAIEFIESGWDVQAIHRLILSSATFQQSAKLPAHLKERDPENRLLARGPRFRLDGFAIRDMALQAGGLLSSKVGGAPVKPYQPEGLWNAVSGGAGTRYAPDKGDALYRKSMYTYWKRAVNPPRQIIFDSSSREVCNVRQRVTNTPLQALVLMNDETFIEAARKLGEHMMKSGETVDDRVRAGYAKATSYTPTDSQVGILASSYAYYLDHFTEVPDEARELLSTGAAAADSSLDSTQLAAFSMVAHILLNLDETITFE